MAADWHTKVLTLDYDPEAVDVDAIRRQLARFGYESTLVAD